MMNDVETICRSTDVSSSSVPSPSEPQERTTPSALHDLYGRVPLCVGGNWVSQVSPIIMEGYLAARRAYTNMEEEDDYGPYLLLTGYEYAHLARQHLSPNLSSLERREWQRGFIAGWNACTFGF